MSTEHFTITREIGIDAGHRVTDHHSKCKSLHGHRYTVFATCKGPLMESGSQRGMVLDFGFLKDIMMKVIDEYCDHGMILWTLDPLVHHFLNHYDMEATHRKASNIGYVAYPQAPMGKLYLMPDVPTAENLARHWFKRMEGAVYGITEGAAWLESVVVQETPNCSAEYTRHDE